MEQLDFGTNWQSGSEDQKEEKTEETPKERPIEIKEDERDCPVCGGSGPCYACDRGRAVAEEFKQQAKKAKESKPKKRGYKKVA
jgi:hypothetical protein